MQWIFTHICLQDTCMPIQSFPRYLMLILWVIFMGLGNYNHQIGGKKCLFWLGKQPVFGYCKEGFFGPGLKV